MLKWLAIACVALLLATTVTSKLWLSTRDALTTERLRAEQLDGQLAALAERQERRAEGEVYQLEVRSASSSEEWGANSVPASVKRVLCKKANCKAAEVPHPNNSSRD